ncbi:MAG: hypothetical protein AB4911_00565 [Oscillochloridaceae bacterium umkhey_bin13]
MEISCRRCGVRIPAVDVNLHTMAAKCQACHAVFSIADQFGSTSTLASAAVAPRDLPMPERFVVEYPAGALQISWRWFTPAALGLLLFAVFWNGFVCFGVAMALAAGEGAAVLFASIHILAGIGVGYASLTMLFNRTTIEVTHGALTINHGPLPVTGYRHLPREQLRQLYGVEATRRSNKRTVIVYHLQALSNDDKQITLIDGLESAQQVLYLEQEIERFLGIRDEPIKGELRK